ncbi:RNA polymerase sigma factor [Parendozoicomonas haliclonae]|uniref:ECF RNA polymerase sigma factor SigW n=1 Tax=Parendozoicomonas haliclonae TaxID=1960125 RepID=A0A1X7ARX8_9GAMM|nr:RNA polymerase sigma factor [Parendozoicomonas haliclonae]SMA50859.1 ECF RNA polymerase sigma factor SigW [Parendozoicomonas haliclonae]
MDTAEIVPADCSDTELIRATLAGNQQAFRIIVERYEDSVAATVFSMVGNIPEAEDIGQETMIRLYQSLHTFKGEASLKTWICRIAINLSLDYLRRKKRRWLWFLDNGTEVLESIPNPSCNNRQWEQREAIQTSLMQLKPEFRAVVTLRLIQGYSTEETAEILQLPVGTVLSRLTRGKSKLLEQLKERI